MARETWTDERLDDLSKRVDEGFRESRADLRQFRQEVRSDIGSLRTEDIGSLRTDMNRRFDEAKADVDRRFDKVDARFDKVEASFDSLQRMLLGGFFTVLLSVLLTRI